MEIWIYFDYGIIIKPTYNSCRLRSPTVASIHPPTLCINIRGLFLICTHSSHHISLSLYYADMSLFSIALKWVSLSHTCEAGSCWIWSCNCRSKDWLAWPRRSHLWNYVVGSSEPPLKAATFGGGMKSIRRTVCKISTALVWSRKLLKLKMELQK